MLQRLLNWGDVDSGLSKGDTAGGTVLVSACGTPAWQPPEARAAKSKLGGPTARDCVSEYPGDVWTLGFMLLSLVGNTPAVGTGSRGTLPVSTAE
jgi:hypothetical protein